MNKFNYGIVIEPLSDDDGGGYVARVPDLPGCMTDGDTVEEALLKIQDAIETWIFAEKKMGRNIPDPSTYKSTEDYSGKLTLRLPKTLHKELAQYSIEEGVSLNSLIIHYVSKGLGKDSVIKEAHSRQKTAESFLTWMLQDKKTEFSSRIHSHIRIPHQNRLFKQQEEFIHPIAFDVKVGGDLEQ